MCPDIKELKWLATVYSSFQDKTFLGHFSHSLSVDAAIMVSKSCQIIGEHVVIIFVTK